MSSAIDRLLRFHCSCMKLTRRSAPKPSVPNAPRRASPVPGGSTFTTSAPQSASTAPADGENPQLSTSSTRNPSSGSVMDTRLAHSACRCSAHHRVEPGGPRPLACERRSVGPVGTEETHDPRYDRVDGDPNLAVLVATMDATSEWEAIRRLRAWERAQLALTPGRRLLDVGCGPGHAAVILAEDHGDGGEIVGLDASVEMIAVARERARAARC